MSRAAPRPGAPAVDGGVRGGDHRGVMGEAEVVVRRERAPTPSAVGPRGRTGAARVEVAPAAPICSARATRGLAVGPVRQVGHVGDLVERVGERVHDAVQLLAT